MEGEEEEEEKEEKEVSLSWRGIKLRDAEKPVEPSHQKPLLSKGPCSTFTLGLRKTWHRSAICRQFQTWLLA